jgi:hypothetical protein
MHCCRSKRKRRRRDRICSGPGKRPNGGNPHNLDCRAYGKGSAHYYSRPMTMIGFVTAVAMLASLLPNSDLKNRFSQLQQKFHVNSLNFIDFHEIITSITLFISRY